MSESRPDRIAQLKEHWRNALGSDEALTDPDVVATRLQDAAAEIGIDIDKTAIAERMRAVASSAEGRFDRGKLDRWLEETDTGTMREWFHEAKTISGTAGAAMLDHARRLGEHTPASVDKFVGSAKERLGQFLGSEELARDGELEQLKGDIKERLVADDETR
jgi:uncharacterized protein YjbJ (UPF0337 family)